MRRLGPFILALTLTLACGPEPLPADGGSETTQGDGDSDSPLGLVCDPSANNIMCESAGGICCSDDPAALALDDLAAQVTPNYQGRPGTGTPLFSGANNPLSRWGVCVAEGSVAASDALTEVNAVGCPVPCNPTWSATDVASVCGTNRVCCQTVELQPEDCVFDPNPGDLGCWRPVTGDDIEGFGGIDATNWGSTDHATHQDPGGNNCLTFVSGIPASVLADNGLDQNDVLVACWRRLGVADLRGLCATTDTACPLADPGYIDACEQMNLDEGRTGCD